MKFVLNCAQCVVRQVSQVVDMCGFDDANGKETLREVLNFLGNVDYSKSTPEIMGLMWDILEKQFGYRDLYRPIKTQFNKAVMSQIPSLQERLNTITDSYKRFHTALCMDIAGNLIDFAASSSFDIKDLETKILSLTQTQFAIDDSHLLYEMLSKAESVLCLGDNCGEIALDKMFLSEIKKMFPNVKIYFAVRGKAILNDVTLDDAKEVEMEQTATVISNGDISAGTVLSLVSPEFKQIFDSSSVIIAKGQGNFESLYPIKNNRLFYTFMAKCPATAKMANVPTGSIVCMAAATCS